MRSGIAEIGVFLAAPARGQGIVIEAVRSMLDPALRQVFQVRETYLDLEVWAVLREEWQA